ncbi:hypothetical protein OC842_004975 [Tilletia horrida]|uniref:Uncharacterized protein n=1 Tax=Tilletia horrida TaxID=155126 RepID=A0AAN6GD75_9BASI|nr:hypothetical protein OC842_004975 [Tilletia horrida]
MDIASPSDLHTQQDCAPHESASAAAQVWQIPELALLILSHLAHARAQPDLLTLSTLSHPLRALAVPLLVQHLDVPLSRIAEVLRFIERNEVGAVGVRSVRVWDDVCSAKIRGRAHSRPGPRAEVDRSRRCAPDSPDLDAPVSALDEAGPGTDADWAEVGRLLGVLEAAHERARTQTQQKQRPQLALPTLDITFDILSIGSLDAVLAAHPALAKRLVALRVLASQDSSFEPPMDEDPLGFDAYVNTCGERWGRLGAMLQRIYASFAPEETPALRLFHAEDYLENSAEHWYIDSAAWRSLGACLPSSVRDLAIRLSMDEEDPERSCSLLHAHWPHLRTFSLVATETGLMDWDRVQATLDDFLLRHPHIEDLRIQAHTFLEPGPLPHYFPRLRVCAVDKTAPAHLGPFLLRHADTLQDLTVPPMDLDAAVEALLSPLVELDGASATTAGAGEGSGPQMVPFAFAKLEVLRAPRAVAAAFVRRAGSRIKHLELAAVHRDTDLAFSEWLTPLPEAARAVSCLDIEITRQTMDYVLSRLRTTLLPPPDAVPNLAELLICCSLDANLTQHSDERAWAQVRNALGALREYASLRAVRLESVTAPVLSLPKGDDAAAAVIEFGEDEAPPSLEYLSWHVPSLNRTQYFRLVPVNSSQTTSGRRRLQAMPASFRLSVGRDGEDGEDGVWGQLPSALRSGAALFDHTRTPPMLR